jgi:hypothetical protein
LGPVKSICPLCGIDEGKVLKSHYIRYRSAKLDQGGVVPAHRAAPTGDFFGTKPQVKIPAHLKDLAKISKV